MLRLTVVAVLLLFFFFLQVYLYINIIIMVFKNMLLLASLVTAANAADVNLKSALPNNMLAGVTPDHIDFVFEVGPNDAPVGAVIKLNTGITTDGDSAVHSLWTGDGDAVCSMLDFTTASDTSGTSNAGDITGTVSGRTTPPKSCTASSGNDLTLSQGGCGGQCNDKAKCLSVSGNTWTSESLVLTVANTPLLAGKLTTYCKNCDSQNNHVAGDGQGTTACTTQQECTDSLGQCWLTTGGGRITAVTDEASCTDAGPTDRTWFAAEWVSYGTRTARCTGLLSTNPDYGRIKTSVEFAKTDGLSGSQTLLTSTCEQCKNGQAGCMCNFEYKNTAMMCGTCATAIAETSEQCNVDKNVDSVAGRLCASPLAQYSGTDPNTCVGYPCTQAEFGNAASTCCYLPPRKSMTKPERSKCCYLPLLNFCKLL